MSLFSDNRRDRHNSNHEEEPEWFSGGPISKSDTIELHGFERERRDSDRQGDRRRGQQQQEKKEPDEDVASDTEDTTEGRPGPDGSSLVA